MKRAINTNGVVAGLAGSWPQGNDEMSSFVRNFDWTGTALGAPASWSERQKIIVEMALASPTPSAVLWSKEGLTIYNEAYASFSGDRHPEIFGIPFSKAWPEAAGFIAGVIDGCFRGVSLNFADQHFVIRQPGGRNDVWLNLTFIPVRNDVGDVMGVFATIIDVSTAHAADDASASGMSVESIGTPPAPVSVEKKKVGLVEDYAPNILVAREFLESFGYEVGVAKNGAEALEAVAQDKYAAILMDVNMQGMNGIDATLYIREWEKKQRGPAIPIIGMTAHALSGDRERCLAVGMNDYIAKPYQPDDLREKLAAFLA